MSQSTSFFKDGMRKLFKNPLAVASIIVLVAIIITIIVAPMIVPYGYEEILSVNGKRAAGSPDTRPGRRPSRRDRATGRVFCIPVF